MYSKIHSRLDWFFGYIGEPEDDECEIELYGDVNQDNLLNISDIVILVNFILDNGVPGEYCLFLTADISQDGILNILDVIQTVQEILGTTFRGAVEWLIQNFPELEVEKRLQELDKSIHFAK